jgi:hypothetical protein
MHDHIHGADAPRGAAQQAEGEEVMRRHDRGLFWAQKVPEGFRIWNTDTDAKKPPEYTLHVMVPIKDYDKLRAALNATKASKRKGKR